MSARQGEVRLMADVSAFKEILERARGALADWAYVNRGPARRRRMHSAYSRRRGRGRW